jgi:hypothetical protein
MNSHGFSNVSPECSGLAYLDSGIHRIACCFHQSYRIRVDLAYRIGLVQIAVKAYGNVSSSEALLNLTLTIFVYRDIFQCDELT